MKRTLQIGLVAVACWFGQLGAARLAAAEAVSTDRLLPPEVSLYVTMPSVTEFKSRWAKSAYGELQADTALADFWSDVREQLQQASTKLEKEVGVSLEELLNLPGGEVAFALVNSPGKPLAAVGFLDFGKSDQTLDKLLEKAAKALEEQGATQATKEVDDTRITVYTLKQEKANDAADANNSDEDAAQPKTLAYFIRDSLFVVSNSVDVLEAVLTRWNGQHPSTFADNEVYRYITEQCKNDNSTAALTWYVDPIGLVQALVTAAAEPNLQVQMALGFMGAPAFGLTNFKAVGGSFDLATEKFDTVSRAFAYVQAPASGILNIFQFPAEEQDPPAWVSANATAYFSLNWNVGSAFAAIETLIDTFRGPGQFSKMIEQLATQEGSPQIHLKKDFIDHLAGRIHVVRDTPNPDDINSDRMLFALELKDEAKMKATLGKIAVFPGFPGKTRDFKGETIYEVSVPSGLGGATSDMGFAVTRSCLMIGNDVTLLEQIMRGDSGQTTLAQSPEYRRIAEHFQNKTSILGYQKQDSQVKAAYEMLRSGQSGALLPGLDFTKLPKFEVIQKYLQPAGSYAVPDRYGALFVNFSLRLPRR